MFLLKPRIEMQQECVACKMEKQKRNNFYVNKKFHLNLTLVKLQKTFFL